MISFTRELMVELVALKGQRFGRWLLIKNLGVIKGNTTVLCRCDCGTERIIRFTYLKHGKSLSCGCLSAEMASERLLSHGMCGTAIYWVWCGIKQRCLYPKHKYWKNYGARGIQICDRWKDSFENFYADMGDVPFPGAQIDRKDNNGHYEPSNCQWSTGSVNQRNKRNNLLITFNGETKCLAAWVEETGINKQTLYTRIQRGWNAEKALTTPIWATGSEKQRNKRNNLLVTFNGETKCLTAWAEATGINKQTLYTRIQRYGWSAEKALTTPILNDHGGGGGSTVEAGAD